MSDNPSNESESMKAARHVPPLPHARDFANSSSMGMAIPVLLSVGGAIAAGLFAEKSNHTVSRGASRIRDDAEELYGSARHHGGDWARSTGESLLSAGAKAAGVTGLLKTLGSGKLSSTAATAAKALAAKKIAEYGASGAKRAGRFATRHPGLTVGGTAAAMKTRSFAREGSSRARDAYSVLRHGRKSVQESHGVMPGAATGLALLGIGAAAMYLFHPELGQHRRRVLREQLTGAGRQAANGAGSLYHRVYDTGTQWTHRGGDAAHGYAGQAQEQARRAADQARDAASTATEQARNTADRAAQAVQGSDAGGSTSQENSGNE